MDDYSIESTHEALKNKLIDYVETAYFGKNDELRNLCKDELELQGVMWQEPYIEANPAYLSVEDGIHNSSNIPDDIKEILGKMTSRDLGVYKSPYSHQIEAVEAFYQGRDLFVSTGTGSGKTECFMWPMISKLVREAKVNKKSWHQRGVRAMMLYPMNALVSDQLGRLRRMIGADAFYICSNLSSVYIDGQAVANMLTGENDAGGLLGNIDTSEKVYINNTLTYNNLRPSPKIFVKNFR